MSPRSHAQHSEFCFIPGFDLFYFLVLWLLMVICGLLLNQGVLVYHCP